MSDAAQANISKYKAGFTQTKPSCCKTTPFKIVPGISAEQLASMGCKPVTYPQPTNPHKK